MIVVLIFIVAFAFWAMLEDGSEGLIPGAIGGATVGFIVALFIGGIAYTDSHWEHKSTTPLVSLADGSSVHGSFFLGSGYVDGSPSYTWYESNGENNYVRKDVEAGVATIHYLPKGETPYYTIRQKKADDKSFWQPWGFNTYGTWDEKYNFYVPQGSIQQSYTLDNK